MRVDEAYKACEKITASQAKNFYYGIKLLPPPKRQAMSALYALARRIDDVGDGPLPRAAKFEALDTVRGEVTALRADPSSALASQDPVLVAIADASRRWGIPLDAIEDLVDGCKMDVAGTTYDNIDELVVYCRKVAGTVGRCSLAIYGNHQPGRAEILADDLGVALQLTNILRDIVEDYRDMGRVYLPREDLARFGVGEDLQGQQDDLAALISFEAGRACEWYDRGLPLLELLDRRSRACTAAMAGIYRKLLERILRDPTLVLRTRVSLGTADKSIVAARAVLTGSV
ncbi:MAG: phytoene/squalene synthase family protein [Acidimicrobiales bacterium]